MLLDLLALRPWWSRHDASWVAVAGPDTRELLAAERVTWAEELTPRPAAGAGPRRPAARAHLRRDRIDLVVSAGTGVAVPYFLAARFAGVPAWWVETLNVICRAPASPPGSARGPATWSLVQHSTMLADYPRALFVGELY